MLTAAILMIGFVLGLIRPAQAIQEDTSSRLDARAFFAKNCDKVRSLIGSDPNEAGVRLEWEIVRPMGDDPRVLGFLEELISDSPSSFAAEVVLAETRSVVEYYSDEIRKARTVPVVLRIVDRGLRNPNVGARLMAAEVLRALGPQYDARLQAAYLDVFATEVAPSVDDSARKDMVRVVRGLLRRVNADPRTRRLIRTATEKYNLLAFFRSRIEVPQQPGTLAERMKDFEAWQRLMWSSK